jgi:hypothetical protein
MGLKAHASARRADLQKLDRNIVGDRKGHRAIGGRLMVTPPLSRACHVA